jgi:HlyD family secretion protein
MKKKRGKKKWVFIVILVVVAVVIVFRTINRGSGQVDKKGNTVKVEYGGVLDRLTEIGTIELVRSVDVKSKISGKIKEILVEEGEMVRANQVLAIVEPDPNQALQLYGKRAAVERAKIEYLEKEKELNRNRALFQKNLISRQELEKLENLFQLSFNAYNQAQLEQQILEMEMAEASSQASGNLDQKKITELDDYRITAPISGLVIAREVEEGEMVVTGISSYMVGTTVFQIGDPSEMIVKSSISEVDVGRIKVGQNVKIVTDSYPEISYQGRVKSIAPVGKIKQGETIVTFEAEIEILDPDVKLRQGMSCDIDIYVDRRENVLVLPVEAVFEVMAKDIEGEDTAKVDHVVAYKWTGTEFEEVKVEVGLESSNRVEILSGVAEGDVVSLEAAQKYKEFRKKEEQEKAAKTVKQEDEK